MILSQTDTTPADLYDDFAPFYDLSDLDREPEVAFYRSLVRDSDRSLLELGCGTGSIAAGVAELLFRNGDGRTRVVGLDRSSKMVEFARARYPSIEWRIGDMSAPDVGSGFDLVICAFNTLQMLISESQMLETFVATRGLLSTQGRFVFDLYNASYEGESGAPPQQPAERPQGRVARRFVDRQGRALEVIEDAYDDPGAAFVRLYWRVVDSADPRREPLAKLELELRHYSTADIERLLQAAGLRIIERFGDVRRSPFSASGSKKHIVVCEASR